MEAPATSSYQVRSEVEQVAGVLLDQVERLAERSVARMQELLPSCATLPAEQLIPVTITELRALLDAIRAPDADPTRVEDSFRVSGKARAGQGIPGDEVLQACRIVLEVVREEAHPVARHLGLADDVVLGFVEASLQWGETGMRASALAYREAEVRELERLAAEQAALRRVATLVAEGGAPNDVFGTVAVELADVLRADHVAVCRYELGSELTVLAHRTTASLEVPSGTRITQKEAGVEAVVWRTGRSAELKSHEGVPGPITDLVHAEGVEVTVGAPVVVAGRLWGVASAGWNVGQCPPADTEQRMAGFAELLATAIANADSNEALRRLADEQAGLRRVATLVAEGAAPTAVLDAVIVEIERLLSAGGVTLLRYEPEDEATVLAHRGPGAQFVPLGTRVSHADGESATAIVWRSKRPARHLHTDDAAGALPAIAHKMALRTAVGAPLVVEGKLWGCVVAHWPSDDAPANGTERRMAKFAALLATAIANSESSEALRRLADEQAALRRVATLVAQGASPAEVFGAVAEEMAVLLDARGITLCRYEPGDGVTVLAHRGPDAAPTPPGSQVRHDGTGMSAAGQRTHRPVDLDSDPEAREHIGQVMERLECRSGVGAPIVVDGRLWGAAIANWADESSPPPDAEERMAQFTRLLGTAIANADSRDQLTASRARLVTEAHDARRRVVRDLHDGAQQRLVHTIVTLKLAQRALAPDDEKMRSLLAEALEQAQQGNRELRELAHGILPAILTQGGLLAGVETVVARLDLPVDLDIPAERFPAEIEASAYFVVAEALTNIVKHSHADNASVRALVDGGMLRVEVRDDGLGGADPAGHGFVGLEDRVTALGGQLTLESPAGSGTVVSATLPLNPE